MVIKQHEKKVHEDLCISRENSNGLTKLKRRDLIESKSDFVDKLLSKYIPLMLEDNKELEETNLLISKEDLIKELSEEESRQKIFNELINLSPGEKELINKMRVQIQEYGTVKLELKSKYEEFKTRGFIE